MISGKQIHEAVEISYTMCSWSEVPQQDRGLQLSSAFSDKNAQLIAFCN
jgi:hypothetical protein